MCASSHNGSFVASSSRCRRWETACLQLGEKVRYFTPWPPNRSASSTTARSTCCSSVPRARRPKLRRGLAENWHWSIRDPCSSPVRRWHRQRGRAQPCATPPPLPAAVSAVPGRRERGKHGRRPPHSQPAARPVRRASKYRGRPYQYVLFRSTMALAQKTRTPGKHSMMGCATDRLDRP